MKTNELSVNQFKKIKPETANDTTRMVINFLKQKGCYVTRINNTGIYDTKKSVFRKSHMERGTPDLLFCCYGNFIACEVKKKDKLSEHQIKTKELIEKSGGKYYVIHSFDEFMELIGKFL